MSGGYASSPIKHRRQRRTRAQMEVLREAIVGVLLRDRPMTVRQVFYQLVSQGVIAKTEAEYTATVGRLLTEMRQEDEIPFEWIADNTRWMRKPRTYSSLESALKRTAEAYRRSLWDNQGGYVEVWLEKEALAGVLIHETDPYDVPLMVTRGYPSLTFVYSAAKQIASAGKPAYLYYIGDHDPSGVDIARNVEERLRQFLPETEITFERIAVTPDQIATWNLPTRPTKTTDTRSRNFKGESVEVDAIPANLLRRITRESIEWHIDKPALGFTRLVEAEERLSLHQMFGTRGLV